MSNNSSFPQLSLQERDRRFSKIRQLMGPREIDGLVVRVDSSKWDSGCAAGRYLTQIGGNGEEGYVIFDLHSDPVFFTSAAAHIDNWLETQAWTIDIRPCEIPPAKSLASCLKERGIGSGRLGLIGLLGSQLDRGEGRWPHKTYVELRNGLPEAIFVEFDRELHEAMAIKSDEEIACHESAMAIVERAVYVMRDRVARGVRLLDVVSSMVATMIQSGGEFPSMVLFGANSRPTVANRIYPDRRLELGDVLLTEITSKYNGYFAQAHVPGSIGAPSRVHQRMFDTVLDCYHCGEAVLKPGISSYELAEAMREPIYRAGYIPAPFPLFKGIGLALADYPVSPRIESDWTDESYPIIQSGMVLTFEPGVYDPEKKVGINVAETLLVTPDGARRLGTRILEFAVF